VLGVYHAARDAIGGAEYAVVMLAEQPLQIAHRNRRGVGRRFGLRARNHLKSSSVRCDFDLLADLISVVLHRHKRSFSKFVNRQFDYRQAAGSGELLMKLQLSRDGVQTRLYPINGLVEME